MRRAGEGLVACFDAPEGLVASALVASVQLWGWYHIPLAAARVKRSAPRDGHPKVALQTTNEDSHAGPGEEEVYESLWTKTKFEAPRGFNELMDKIADSAKAVALEWCNINDVAEGDPSIGLNAGPGRGRGGGKGARFARRA